MAARFRLDGMAMQLYKELYDQLKTLKARIALNNFVEYVTVVMKR